jgi:hypothetical protein
MNFLGNGFLAASAFAVDDHRIIGGAHKVDLLQQLLNVAVSPKYIRRNALYGALSFDMSVAGLPLTGAAVRLLFYCHRNVSAGAVSRLFDGYQNLIGKQRFGNIIVSAHLHYFHGYFYIAVAGYDDHRYMGVSFLYFASSTLPSMSSSRKSHITRSGSTVSSNSNAFCRCTIPAPQIHDVKENVLTAGTYPCHHQ